MESRNMKLTPRGELVADMLALAGIILGVASFSLIAYLIGA